VSISAAVLTTVSSTNIGAIVVSIIAAFERTVDFTFLSAIHSTDHSTDYITDLAAFSTTDVPTVN
jgi:hypothetical protein